MLSKMVPYTFHLHTQVTRDMSEPLYKYSELQDKPVTADEYQKALGINEERKEETDKKARRSLQTM